LADNQGKIIVDAFIDQWRYYITNGNNFGWMELMPLGKSPIVIT
jgi:hypothetical protein